MKKLRNIFCQNFGKKYWFKNKDVTMTNGIKIEKHHTQSQRRIFLRKKFRKMTMWNLQTFKIQNFSLSVTGIQLYKINSNEQLTPLPRTRVSNISKLLSNKMNQILWWKKIIQVLFFFFKQTYLLNKQKKLSTDWIRKKWQFSTVSLSP